MKKSELKEMIKAAFLSEADFTNAQDDDAALGGMYDPVYEAEEEESLDDILARVMGTSADPYMAEDLSEQEDEEEETSVTMDAEEETDGGEEKSSDSIVIDKKIVSLSSLPSETRKILDTLETLRAQAEEFGDQKFITQVGNTITFFTRDFVVAGDEPTRAKVDESLEILKMKKLAGLLTEGEYAKALLRENQTNFPSEDEIKRKGAVGDSVTVSKDGKNYDINYTISSESDDEMSFGIYDSEEGEDAEQIEEFYTYKELINWFNN
jgi:ribosome-associated protein YbcJ (S4-like RNA binding protein)